MLFTSYTFGFFFVFFLLCWRYFPANRIYTIAISSVIFYGAWNPYFVLLIFYSAIIDFVAALQIERRPDRKKLFLLISIVGNLGILGFFKYFGFFDTLRCDALGLFENACAPSKLDIILPVGIRFYTFQTMAYTFDVYRGEFKAVRSFSQYFCYVSFFPQLIAGPIERAGNILPQIRKLAAGEPLQSDWEGGFR